MSLTTILSAGEFHSLNSLSVGSRLNAVWGKSPGLVYVKDPINALQNQLLNDWKDWDYLLHCESIIPADLSNQQREDLETLLFLGIYISKNTSKTGRLLDKLLKSDSFSPILGKAFWITVFEKKNLRIIPTNNSTTKWTLDINDILEKIRIEKLKEDGYFDPDTILKSSNDKSNQLVNVLSTSYFSALEFKNISLSIFNINMEVLALYAPVLPSSWYTNGKSIQLIHEI
ncbi:hypothetical protein BC833DRAFT_144921 [Globomyces pollinis-pini]|nr:hypothetical protein BC833DRAFT_144921 [Globomyces pollinis-pini]